MAGPQTRTERCFQLSFPHGRLTFCSLFAGRRCCGGEGEKVAATAVAMVEVKAAATVEIVFTNSVTLTRVP